jgi:peptide/nickel transport system permease protein
MSTLAISLPRIARHNPLAAVGVVLVSIFVFAAIFAPWIAPQDPAHIDLPNRLQTPSTQHWCGTDELGRDILARLIWGARISLFVGSSVVACSLLLGLIIGSLAGYYGGAIDRFVNVVLMNAFLSFPGILIAIAFVAFRGPGIFNLDEFPGIRRAAADRKLGIDAERRPLTSFRCASSGALPSGDGDARSPRFQLYRRRLA